MESSKNKLLNLIGKLKKINHLIYVIDDSSTEEEFKMIAAEMIKIKSNQPNFIFYVETKNKEHYDYLYGQVFNWGDSSSVLPQVGREIELKIIEMAKMLVCIKCEKCNKKKRIATEKSFIIKYEK